jgi:hypothetical protein
MNFDLVDVRPFLQKLNKLLGGTLDVEALHKLATSTEVQHDREITVKVTFKNEPVELTYQVFMDDVDAPDIYFFTKCQPLAAMIEKEMARFAEESGI